MFITVFVVSVIVHESTHNHESILEEDISHVRVDCPVVGSHNGVVFQATVFVFTGVWLILRRIASS